MSLWVLLLLFLLLSFLYGCLLRYLALPHIRLERRFLRPAVFCGEVSEMQETIENNGPLFLPWIRVESRISPFLRFGKTENLQIEGEMYHRSLFTLMPYQRIIRHHRVTFLHRGIFSVGSAALSLGDVTGWYQSLRETDTPMQVTVFPRILEDDTLPQPLINRMQDITRQMQLMTDPVMIRGIRDYVQGDAVRDIHWAATAKMQSPQVKVHEYATHRKLMVVINSQTREDQWDMLMDYEQERIENLISCAATLCMRALDQGMECGFAGNMPLEGEDEKQSAYVMSLPDRDYRESLLTAFARLRVMRTLAFLTFLEQLPVPPSTQVVILSCYTSALLESYVSQMRARGIPAALVPIGEV